MCKCIVYFIYVCYINVLEVISNYNVLLYLIMLKDSSMHLLLNINCSLESNVLNNSLLLCRVICISSISSNVDPIILIKKNKNNILTTFIEFLTHTVHRG